MTVLLHGKLGRLYGGSVIERIDKISSRVISTDSVYGMEE